MTPYRFEPQDQREMNRLVSEALREYEDYTPPLVQTRSGTFDLMGTKVFVSLGALVRMHHVTDARQKIKIMTNDWTWEGSVRVTVHDYTGGGKQYIRHFAMDETGYLDGDETRFARDIIMIKMMQD